MSKVVLLDDDEFLLEGLELSLRNTDFEFFTSSSVDRALSLMEEIAVDVLISDICMPAQGGVRFLRECFLRWPNVPRIILTGFITSDLTLKAINEFQVYRVLSKPCSPKDILENINNALTERQLILGRNDLIDLGIEKIQDDLIGSGSLDDEFQNLSAREKEVLHQLILGSRVPKISEVLSISQHTVRNHLKSIYQKLHVHSQQELIELVTSHRQNQNSSL